MSRRKEGRACTLLIFMKSKKNKIWFFLVIPIFLVASTGTIFLYQKRELAKTPVIYVGEHPVTQTEYQYFFSTIVSNFTYMYGDYMDSIGLDVSKPLDTQECSIGEDGQTWQEFFTDATREALQEKIPLYYQAINDEKFSYNLEQEWQSFVVAMENNARQRNLNVKQIYVNLFGKYANKQDVKNAFLKYSVPTLYENDLKKKHVLTEEEIKQYYEDNKKDFDTVTYRVFKISSPDYDESNLSAAESRAQEFYSKVYDEDTFKNLCIEYSNTQAEKDSYKENDASLRKDKYGNITVSEIANWLFDEARIEKATSVIKSNDGKDFYIVYFISRELDQTYTVDFKHILVTPGTTNMNLASEDDKQVALNSAKKIYSLFSESDKSEAKFEELVKEYSEDNGSSQNGGEYDSVEYGEMVDPINNWIFDESREYGDTEIIESEFGYHIVFFKNKREPAWENNVKNKKTQEYISAYKENLVKENPLRDVVASK